MDELWESVLAEIEVEVSKPTFLTFFKGTGLVELQDSVATISSPTQITAEYIEKRYYSLIKRALDKKTGGNLSLVFVSQQKNQVQGGTTNGPLFAKEIKTQKLKPRPERIRQDYTFETFAVSDGNQLAYTASKTVASNPGGKYNPLFIYGTVGVGKTHLLNAIANEVLEKDALFKILYLTTEEFTNEVVEAIRDKATSGLRKKFRGGDLLLLDDIQFLTGKEKVQEEIFHTFNTLIDKGKQVVFSSDKPPQEIKKIEARLKSRFEGGLTVDIQPPDFELRCAILLIKAKKYALPLSVESSKMIAEQIKDTRALEGFLIRLSTEVSTSGDNTIEDLTDGLLKKQAKTESISISPEVIIKEVCSFYDIKPTQLKGVYRNAHLVRPRHISMFLLREAGFTLVEIGNLLGGRDHTTVLHGIEKIKKLFPLSTREREEIQFIKRKISGEFLH